MSQPKQESVMQEAERIIYGDREETYGNPSKNLQRIAELWTAYLKTDAHGLDITITNVCRMMQLLKWARDENSPKRDNIVDDIGYAALVHRCREPFQIEDYLKNVPAGVDPNVRGVKSISKSKSRKR